MAAKEPQEPFSRPVPSQRAAKTKGRSPGEQTAGDRLRVDVPALQAAEEWQCTFDVVRDLIAILDTQHRIVRVNKAMADRLGLTKDQCVGQTCYRLVHGTDEPPSFCPHSRLLQDGEEHAVEFHEERLAGDFLTTVSPLRDSAGRPVGSVCLARDITERKRAEVALRRSEKMQAEAEKLAATGRMAAHMAHEINNPLAGIKNSFRLIRDAVPEDHPDHDMVGRIEREIDRIAHVVRQMYKLHAPDAQTAIDIPVEETIRDVLVMLEPLGREHEVAMELAPVSPTLIVKAPEGSLQQVLYNLTVNAVQASPRNGVVNIVAEPVDKDYVRISIRDRGPGIPAEVRERMFEPFFSADTASRAKEGIGLGLSIVRSIVESLGGKIEFESRVGKGTCFHVYLPSKQP